MWVENDWSDHEVFECEHVEQLGLVQWRYTILALSSSWLDKKVFDEMFPGLQLGLVQWRYTILASSSSWLDKKVFDEMLPGLQGFLHAN